MPKNGQEFSVSAKTPSGAKEPKPLLVLHPDKPGMKRRKVLH